MNGTLDEKWIVWAKTIAAPEENVALKKALQALYPQQPEPDEQDEWCDRCQNTGYLDCHCGGDLCVCSHNGEYPCPDCQ